MMWITNNGVKPVAKTIAIRHNTNITWTLSVPQSSKFSISFVLKKFDASKKINFNTIVPAGFEAKTRGGTLGVPGCIHTRTKNIS